jgi:cytoplasmic iron level regulating protein YaaA (DUF328/UPF0246 family)
MRPAAQDAGSTQVPQLLSKAKLLTKSLQSLTDTQLEKMMQISPKLAKRTHQLIATWTTKPANQRLAIDSFLGDIYSGLQVQDWTGKDRSYANQNLRILSGLYGVLKPLDGIYPYRFEMGYELPDKKYTNLYEFWGDSIAKTLPKDGPVVNLAAVEYSKTVMPYITPGRIFTPSFLTINPKTKEPSFVVVHAKIARGAYAHWLIKHQIDDAARLHEFNELRYAYDAKLSSPNMPVFVCQNFGGLGLSVRLT